MSNTPPPHQPYQPPYPPQTPYPSPYPPQTPYPSPYPTQGSSVSPYPTQGSYPPPYPPQSPYQPQGTNGIAIAGMVVGIVGLAFGWIPSPAIVLGLVAVILSGIGLHKANTKNAGYRGMAVAGLVCGILAVLVAVVGRIFGGIHVIL